MKRKEICGLCYVGCPNLPKFKNSTIEQENISQFSRVDLYICSATKVERLSMN